MNKSIVSGLLLIVILLLMWGCDNPADVNKNLAILNGQVINSETLDPVVNAVVVVLEYPEISTFTDASGFFGLEIEVQEAVEIQLRAFKESFISDTLLVLATPGRTISDISMALEPTASTPITSGEAASIILYGVNPNSIGVRESGSPEVAELAFQVQDSSGIPVDLQHSVDVDFILGSNPGEGVFISPTSTTTGAAGLAKTSLFSGTKSGVVQMIAEVSIGTQTLRSMPVAVAIHGGLPDSVHFSLAVEKLNFPGYNIYGLIDRITAYVGDKYGNPVKPETAVYFTTTGGLIEGSAFTDLLGQASVSLVSAAPKPIHPTYGAGFATITGRTADENQNEIEALAIVLFSGVPQISVNPTVIDVPNGGSQYFAYRISDQNDNPLAGGTSISVSVESGNVEAVGNTDLTLPDTQSPAWTFFGFSLIDSEPDTSQVNQVSVKIRTAGPNGNLEYSFGGIAH
ncbi:MAG: hypothetical protein A2Y94_06975 [Caldithrix sp. RBG_13_44_9]|nr:MAG: hypothetical protein A2Y94_06975 [Caldithrix sp. RBG_13_44_9]